MRELLLFCVEDKTHTCQLSVVTVSDKNDISPKCSRLAEKAAP